MKKFLKGLLGIILIPYILLALFITICLINYNDYSIPVLGKYSLIVVDDESLEPNFEKGSLLIIERNDPKDINVDEYVFFYDEDDKQITVNLGRVIDKEIVTETEATFTFEGDHKLSSEYYIGAANTTLIYKGFGTVFSILVSRWGFLLIFILPILIAFILEIIVIVKEVRESKEED